MDAIEVDNSPEAIAKERLEQEQLPYRWKQTLEDVTVTADLKTPTRAKDLKIKITRTKLYIENLVTRQTLIDDDLFTAIDDLESTWSIVDKTELEITLVKRKQEWWPHVVKSAPKIDVRRIQPENSSLNDLDDETRAMVEKMMHEQREKQIQDFAKKSEVRSDISTTPMSTADRLQALENFKKNHPEMDFSQLDTSSI